MSLWKRGALAFVLVLCAAIALAPSTGPSKRIPNGVRISGVNVSNLDAGQARQVISARYGVPLRFRFDQREWTASPKRLGMHADIDGATSRALEAEKGDDIGVSVDVNRDEVRSYVAKLDDQFSIDPANAVVTGLVDGRPQIADSTWGREVRRQTMVRAIVRTLRTRIRQAVPLVTRTLKPSVSKTGFGPVIVIHRGVELPPALQRRDSVAELQRCDRPLSVPDADRQLPDRRHADEPVVAPARLRLGEGPEADPARARATRWGRAGWA